MSGHHVFSKLEYLSAHLYVSMQMESLDRTKCYPPHTKCIESPKLSFVADLKWNFNSDFYVVKEDRKKLRKLGLSSKSKISVLWVWGTVNLLSVP